MTLYNYYPEHLPSRQPCAMLTMHTHVVLLSTFWHAIKPLNSIQIFLPGRGHSWGMTYFVWDRYPSN